MNRMNNMQTAFTFVDGVFTKQTNGVTDVKKETKKERKVRKGMNAAARRSFTSCMPIGPYYGRNPTYWADGRERTSGVPFVKASLYIEGRV